MPATPAPAPTPARRRPRGSALAALCVLALPVAFALPAAAALYKWTDASGRVVYSDQPPPGNVKTETVQAPPPPADPNAVKDMAAKDLEMKQKAREAAAREKKAEAARADTVQRNEQCARVGAQIRQLSADQIALVRANEKGEMVYVDEATRRKEREELAAWQRQNCGAR